VPVSAGELVSPEADEPDDVDEPDGVDPPALLSAFALLVFAPLVFAVEPPEHAASTVAAAASAVTASKARERCLMTEPFLVQDFRNRMARR